MSYAIAGAARNGHLNIVKYLHEHGASIHGASIHKVRNGPLELANRNKKWDVVEYLIDNGANIHIIDLDGLKRAIEDDNYYMVKYLVEHGIQCNTNNAPLKDRLNIVKYLLNTVPYSVSELNKLLYSITDSDVDFVINRQISYLINGY